MIFGFVFMSGGIMNTAMAIRLIGVLIGIGLLLSYSTLYNGFLFITKWQLLTIAIGLAELGRWGFGILAAILMWRLHPFAKWSLLIAFVCGLFGSWDEISKSSALNRYPA